MKKRLLFSILILLFSVSVLVTAVFAWFSSGALYGGFVLTAGEIECEATIYYYRDFNHDGIPDNVDGNYIIDEISAPNITDMKAGDVYQYRIDIKNTGNLAGNLDVYFENIPEEIKAVLTVTSYVKDSDENLIPGAGTDGEKLSLYEDNTFATVSGLAPYDILENPPQAQISVYFSVRFETLDYLKTSLPEVFESKEDLNDYQIKSFEGMKIIVRLTQIPN